MSISRACPLAVEACAPAQAGAQEPQASSRETLGSRLRGNTGFRFERADPRPTSGTPRLLAGISFVTFAELPDWSSGPRGSPAKVYAAIKAAGYEAVQTLDPAVAREAGLIPTGLARAFGLDQLRDVIRRWRDAGCDCTTVQLGTGFESDDEMARLAEGLLDIAEAERHPVYLETHRATMTQDIRRTLDLVERFPELRFNGDFGHWYIGHELPYGDLDAKLEAMRPIFARTRFLHLRVSSGAFGQLTASGAPEVLDHYKRMWRACFEGFLATARPGDHFAVHPELLPPRTGYPRMIPGPDGALREESDRWAEARVLIDVARDCFAEAQELADA
ncbi:sugar phosphate isomerase/epimerase family protein [Sphingomonas sp. DT-204]|uniref:sugar phosphate isomerase/epimerase family protein n=1 Tax=Sphingomonas sp. DT-204 TaxID=3396166 RepID=UPI003F1C9399